MESPELVRVTATGRLAYGGDLRVIVTGDRLEDGSTRFSSGPLCAPSPDAAQPRVRMEAGLGKPIVYPKLSAATSASTLGQDDLTY